MILDQILKNVKTDKIIGSTQIEIFDIVYNSKKVKKECLFVSLSGSKEDGHAYINEAIEKGVAAVLIDKNCEKLAIDFSKLTSPLTMIFVENTRQALAFISSNFFSNPAQKIKTIGITGTKGKTTTSFMIKSILESAGKKSGLIGTLGAFIGDENIKLDNTTPESYEVQKYLSKMVDKGFEYVILEASSRGLQTHRLEGISFDFGIFTNISNDHVGSGEGDHANVQEYINCKSILFKRSKIGIINSDDENYKNIINEHTCKILTYGLKNNPDYKAENINLISENGKVGVRFNILGKKEISNLKIQIPGKFSVYNALAAASACFSMGIKKENISNGLKNAKVRGRVEPIETDRGFSVFIDYAHNAVSMENILTTLKEYNPKRLIVVFGAGGNRPKSRREEVGIIAGKYADFAIITSDNPRFEEPLEIIKDIEKGIKKTSGGYVVISGREEAIKYAIENAEPGDIIVIAGKGHEDYQEIKGIKYPFDDKIIAEKYIKN